MERESIQSAALEVILPLQCSSVVISMGVGKTLIGLLHMKANYTDYVKFLVVAPKKSIFESWKDDAKKFNLEYLLPQITFTTYLSLSKQDIDYDVVYLDEVHSVTLKCYDWLFNHKYKGGKIVGMTGTAPRNEKSEKGKLISEFCPIVYTYKTDTAVKDKILNDYKIIVHILPLDTQKNIRVKDQNWFTSERASYDYWSGRIDAAYGKTLQIMRVMRMKAMMGFPSKERLAKKLFTSTDNKVLLFCNTQDQADRLCTHSYHSNNPKSEENLEMFKSGKITKLASVLQLAEGVNIPNLSEIIICHSFSANSPKTSQFLGRALRLNINELATINILMFSDSIDETWVKSTLDTFDPNKIIYKNFIP